MSQKSYKASLTAEETVLVTKTLWRQGLIEKDEKAKNTAKELVDLLTQVPLEELDKHDPLMYAFKRKHMKHLREMCLSRATGIKALVIPKYEGLGQHDMVAHAKKLLEAFVGLAKKFTV